MERNETEKMVDKFCNMLQKKFGDRVNDIVILNIFDNPNWREFSIEFKAYNCFLSGRSVRTGHLYILELFPIKGYNTTALY